MPLIRTILVSLLLVGLLQGTAWSYTFSFHNPLVDAADAGQEDVVRSLLKARQPVDGRGDFNTTALMRASYRGHVEIAHMLIKSGADLGIQDRGGATALHIAARAGHVAIVKLLLKYGAQLEEKDNEGWTPLMRASMNSHPHVVDALVKAGADIQAENEAGETPVMQAASSGSLDVLSALMESPDFAKVPLSQKEDALAIARKRKHRNIETVFQALIHPPAPPQMAARYGEPVYDGHGAYESKRQSPPPAMQPAPAPSAPLVQDETAPQGQFAVAVPDNGFSDETPYQQPQAAPVAPQPSARPQQQSPYASAAVNPSPVPASFGQPPVYQQPQIRYLLQLGAFANEDQAFYVWSNLKHRNPDMLGALEPDVIKAFLAYDQTEVYRLRASGFSQQEKAEEACRVMRERSIECFVIEKSTGGGVRTAPPAPSQQYVQQQAPQAPQVPTYPAISAQQPQPYQQPAPQQQQQAMMPPQGGQMQPSPYAAYQAGMAQGMGFPQQQAMMQPPVSPVAETPVSPYAPPMPMQQQQAYMPPMAGDGPIDVMSQAAQPMPQQRPAYAANMAAQATPPASNEDVREIARRQFFRSQGMEPPADPQYGDFYRDIQRLEQERQRYGNVSEAVRVNGMPAGATAASQASFGQQMNGIWVHVGEFPTEQYAQDYYQRMFKFDRSFMHLRMVSMRESSPYGQGQAVSMRLGPAGSDAEAYEICRIVKQGGLNCNVLSDNRTAGYQQFTQLGLQAGQGIRQDTLDPFWLTLGTFEDASDAEYYWMFLLDDHFDVLGALKYDLNRRAESSREPFHLKAGPFLVQQQANRLCDVLKYRNVACVVTH